MWLSLDEVIQRVQQIAEKRIDRLFGIGAFGSYGSLQSASATLDGIEVTHMIRKQQFSTSGQSAFQQFAALAA